MIEKKFILYFLFLLLIGPSFAQEAPKDIEKHPLSEEEIVSLLKEKFKDSIMETFIESNPRLTLLTVRVTRDENIKGLWKATLADKTRYYFFVGFIILTVLVNWYWKKRQTQTMAPFWHKIAWWFARFSLVNGARIGFFIFLFKTEINPVWSHAKNIFSV
ncbi:MAG: hypothetical protein DRQ88_04430 [Epsilonproteobacteria bacterium]|nr:MAG: hypothetical protein DRQ89_07365 [Campylobacterota bacterium]RLA67005.1 MAG: hypothetical protein DRQ88_04430 [Campylobacterota bacterium]